MKKLLLFYFLLIVVKTSEAQTSVYHPFPDSNAVWNYHWHQFCFANGFGDDYYSISISGDTVINSGFYHKLNIPFVVSNNASCNSQVTSGYKGAFREDTALRKVFYVEPGDSSEDLLYDFNMQVGDTVRGYTQGWSPDQDIVQSIDSVLVGSNYRKRWYINPCYFIYVIEGIGSTHGLIGLSPGCVTDQPGYTLDCFSINDQSLYPDTITYCGIIDAAKEIPDRKISAAIFPNPFHSSAKLEMRNPKIDIANCEMKIYNTMGTLVRSEDILDITSYILDRDGLSEGLYFYELHPDSPDSYRDRDNSYELFTRGKFIIE